ncbi:MAG: hypothetical protein DI585_05740 [Pseudomonas fluorescens]|nr:MAG: hypothetical protein DI585_05740 [Pseudomonas fluorescens]
MMTLPTYVIRDVAKPTAMSLGVLLGLVWLLQSLRFLDLVVNKGLGFGVFLTLTLTLIPKLLTLILPISVFIATCAMLRRWQEDNELTAVISLGNSPQAVLRPLIVWALAMVACSYVLFLDLMPRSTTAFRDIQYQIRTQNGQLLLEEGTFNQLGKDLMIYLRERETPTTLNQILVHDTRNPAQPVTWFARNGEVTLDADGYPQLALKNGVRQEVGPKNVGMLEFDRYNLDIRQSLGQQVVAPRKREQEEYGLFELRQAAPLEQNEKMRREMISEFHKRLLWPLTPIPLVLLAAAWLLRPPKRHQSSWRLLVAASLSGFAYVGILMVLESASQEGKAWALYGQWGWPAIGIVAAFFISRRKGSA